MATTPIEDLLGSFTGPALDNLGSRLGLPKDVVKQAAPMVTGLVVAGIGRLAKQPGGMDKLTKMLQSGAESFGSGKLEDFVKNVDPAKSGDLLKELAGGNSIENITSNLANKTGIDPEAMSKMVAMQAPAVVGSLGKIAQTKGLDAAGVSQLIEDNSGALKGIGDLDTLLDDAPGFVDDIKRGLNKLFEG